MCAAFFGKITVDNFDTVTFDLKAIGMNKILYHVIFSVFVIQSQIMIGSTVTVSAQSHCESQETLIGLSDPGLKLILYPQCKILSVVK